MMKSPVKLVPSSSVTTPASASYIKQVYQRDFEANLEDKTYHRFNTRGESDINPSTIVLFSRPYPQCVMKVRPVGKKPFVAHIQGLLEVSSRLILDVSMKLPQHCHIKAHTIGGRSGLHDESQNCACSHSDA